MGNIEITESYYTLEGTIMEGDSSSVETTITESMTAKALSSGNLDVLATPAMIAMMENAALNVVAGAFSDGFDSVGIDVLVVHSRPTRVGSKVTATATLTKIEKRKLTFEVVACDEKGEIGRGIHNRFIINVEKFLKKADEMPEPEPPFNVIES